MESKVIVDNTTYAINGGKSCIDGTTYDVSKGKSIIEGVTHDTWAIRVAKVDVVKSPRVMVDAQAAAPYATVRINSEVYNNSSNESLRVPLSTIAQCYVEKASSANAGAAWIRHNGNPIRKLEEAGKATYDHVITTDTTFVVHASGASGLYEGSVHIYDNGYIMFSYVVSEFIAREGMTWEEWINSELAKSTSFVIKDGFVYATETATEPIVNSLEDKIFVKATDTIISNQPYHFYIKTCVVTITGTGGSNASVTINGVNYTTATTLAVPTGTVISCKVKTDYPDSTKYACVYLNDNLLQKGEGTCEYVVIKQITINLNDTEIQTGGVYYEYGVIRITEK